jgi:hypothetical protein
MAFVRLAAIWLSEAGYLSHLPHDFCRGGITSCTQRLSLLPPYPYFSSNLGAAVIGDYFRELNLERVLAGFLMLRDLHTQRSLQ